MTRLERYVYDIVKSKPWLKDFIRNVYQSAFDLLPRKKEFFADEYQGKEHFFLGFHDIQPFSEDGTKILAQHADIEGSMPKEEDKLNVGYFDFADGQIGEFHPIANSFAWNFHKGCRLQWMDDKHIVFNTRENGNVYAYIYDIYDHTRQSLKYAIDSISPNGKNATSMSYERLEYLMPGYGYLYTQDEGYCNEPAPENTGLFMVDMNTQTRTMLFSLAEMRDDIKEVYPQAKTAFHYVTHSSFSPDGRYIACLHRFVQLSDLEARTTRLVIYDTKSKQHFALPTEGMVSHYAWNKENKIVAYCHHKDKDGHVIFNIVDGKCVKATPIAQDKLNSDGHQSWVNSEDFITDTYPDKYRMAKLYYVSDTKVECLAYVYSPKTFQTKSMYNHIACDLHPRVSRDGKYVCFDSPRTGIRALYIMKCK